MSSQVMCDTCFRRYADHDESKHAWINVQDLTLTSTTKQGSVSANRLDFAA